MLEDWSVYQRIQIGLCIISVAINDIGEKVDLFEVQVVGTEALFIDAMVNIKFSLV